MSSDPKVLVALIGQTRATELTFESFRANVLDELGADLALCVASGDGPNPFHEAAKHVWTFDESGGWARHYDDAADDRGWRTLLEIGPMFMGGIEDKTHPQHSSTAISYFYRRLLWRSIQSAGIAGDYDWIVLTRSDFIWPLPHPPVRDLSDRRVYALDGEQYGGICDRHFVIPRRHFAAVTEGLVAPIFEDPAGLKRRIDQVAAQEGWEHVNIERLFALRLRDQGLWRRVRYLPYVPYTVRAEDGPTTWSVGVLDTERGYYVKYPTELERSRIAQRFVSDADSWRRYLSPVRGVRSRWALRRAYRRDGLHERAFPRWGAQRRAAAGRYGAVRTRTQVLAHALAVRTGRRLRTLPLLPTLLDARLRRIRRRAEARAR